MSNETQENGDPVEEIDSNESSNNGLDELLDFTPSDDLIESLADDAATSEGGATDVDGEPVEIAEAAETKPEEVEEIIEEVEDITPAVEVADKVETTEEVTESPTKEERLRETITNLQTELGARSTPPPDITSASPTSEDPTPSGETETVPVETESIQAEQSVLEPVDFVTQEEFLDVFRTKDGLNTLLNKVYAGAAEHITRNLPHLINVSVERQIVLQKATTDFYAENPDLMEHREYVKYKLNQVQGAHPDLGIVELLDKTSAAVRHDLALGDAASATEQSRRKKLGSGNRSFAPTKGNRREKPRGTTDEALSMADKVAELIP